LGFAVNVCGEARNVAGKCAEVLHTAVLSPEEGMRSCVARQVGLTDDLTLVIDVESNVEDRAPKAAEVSRRAVE
jgi:hypothetical protein